MSAVGMPAASNAPTIDPADDPVELVPVLLEHGDRTYERDPLDPAALEYEICFRHRNTLLPVRMPGAETCRMSMDSRE
jgi:hypothetical protein